MPALVQGTKRGELFLLDRRTGTPLAEVREQPVPQGAVPGDWTAKTQPFSVGMPQFRGPDLTEADMWGLTPLDQLWCRIEFRKLRYEGHFTPPYAHRNAAISRQRRRLQLGQRRDRRRESADGREPAADEQSTAAVSARPDSRRAARQQAGRHAVRDDDAAVHVAAVWLPCQKPPYGTIGVVDLKTREVVWNSRSARPTKAVRSASASS